MTINNRFDSTQYMTMINNSIDRSFTIISDDLGDNLFILELLQSDAYNKTERSHASPLNTVASEIDTILDGTKTYIKQQVLHSLQDHLETVSNK